MTVLRQGFITQDLPHLSVDELAALADRAGAPSLELYVGGPGGVIDPSAPDAGNLRAIERLREHGCEVAALATYRLVSGVEPRTAQDAIDVLEATIRLASLAGVPVVSTLSGFPVDEDRDRTITEILPRALGPAVELAGAGGVRLAFENWFETNLRDRSHWHLFFETFPDAHVGLVFDPSHLVWQRIDWEQALVDYGQRVFLAHAKDVAYDDERLGLVGVLGNGWWRYVVPGLGVLSFERYVALLRDVGFDGVLSIEPEDREVSPEEGVVAAAAYLSRFVS